LRQRKNTSYPVQRCGSIVLRSRISTSWKYSSVGFRLNTSALAYWFGPHAPASTAVGSS
jgi:hypothetical protein